MSRLARALTSEIRRVSLDEGTQRTRTSLRKVEKELLALRRELRAQRSLLASVERKLGGLQSTGGRAAGVPRIAPDAIRALRGAMPRNEFAKLVGVSPGSIFGWETGRTLPRGRSVKRLLALQSRGVGVSRPARRRRHA